MQSYPSSDSHLDVLHCDCRGGCGTVAITR